MIDFDDVDDASMFSLFSNGWSAAIFAVIAIVLFFVAMSNSNECEKKTCPLGGKPKLTDHMCACITEAQ